MRSPEAISHRLGPLVGTLRPDREARQARAVARAITPDGRVRADRLDGFIEPERVAMAGLEFVGDAVAELDYPSIAAQTCSELTVTVEGARNNDGVILGPSATLNPNLSALGFVSTTDTVTIRICNPTTGAINPAVKAWKVIVVR